MKFLPRVKNLVKHLLLAHPGIHHFIRRMYYLPRYYLPERVYIKNILEKYSIQNPEINFIQIGANNGIDRFTDFRKRYKWHSILVEPQKKVFLQLKERSKLEQDVVFENLAISNETATKNLYRFSLSSSTWATGIASFEREHIIKCVKQGWFDEQAKSEGFVIPENPDEYIISEDVESITLKDLILKHGLNKIDILAIDTEGHDFEIIKSIDFKYLKPKIILFEFVHLSRDDFKKCRQLLNENGYKLFLEDIDIIATN